MYCEKCKKTFDEDEKCPICGNELIDYTPILDDDDVKDLEAVRKTEYNEEIIAEESEPLVESAPEEPELLVSVEDKEDAERIKELLVNNSIAVFDKTETDENGIEAICIYVPKEAVSQSLEIIREVMPEEIEEELSDEELDELLCQLADETAENEDGTEN